jgi:predicted RNA-binding protein with EMAP domain
MAEYDTYISGDFKDMAEDVEIVTVIRDLTPGKKKYNSMYAKVRVSKDEKKYSNTLRVRLGRGQLVDKVCSVDVIEIVNVIPPGL